MNSSLDPRHQNDGRDWTDTHYDIRTLLGRSHTPQNVRNCMDYIRTKAREIYKTLSDQHRLELLYIESHLREISSMLTNGLVIGNSPSGRDVYDGFRSKLTLEEFQKIHSLSLFLGLLLGDEYDEYKKRHLEYVWTPMNSTPGSTREKVGDIIDLIVG